MGLISLVATIIVCKTREVDLEAADRATIPSSFGDVDPTDAALTVS
jgi:hypothetical protein